MPHALSHFPRLGEHDPGDPIAAVLIQEFQASGNEDGGLDISIHMNADTRILTSASQKGEVRDILDFDEGRAATEQLARVRSGAMPEISITLNTFAFRHANGGILPLIRNDATTEVLLFLRDIHPMGWNIANGASASIDDLLHPRAVAIREATEELLFWDPAEHLAVAISDAQSDDLSAALLLLGEDAALLATANVPMAIDESGPDTLMITLPDGRSHRTRNTYISFNLDDFGIEATWPALLRPAPGLIPRDGEITEEGHLLNRPIGLFSPRRLLAAAAKDTLVTPERIFMRGSEEASPPAAALCPVTQAIVTQLEMLSD